MAINDQLDQNMPKIRHNWPNWQQQYAICSICYYKVPENTDHFKYTPNLEKISGFLWGNYP